MCTSLGPITHRAYGTVKDCNVIWKKIYIYILQKRKDCNTLTICMSVIVLWAWMAACVIPVLWLYVCNTQYCPWLICHNSLNFALIKVKVPLNPHPENTGRWIRRQPNSTLYYHIKTRQLEIIMNDPKERT
jgi:hypothetical protein